MEIERAIELLNVYADDLEREYDRLNQMRQRLNYESNPGNDTGGLRGKHSNENQMFEVVRRARVLENQIRDTRGKATRLPVWVGKRDALATMLQRGTDKHGRPWTKTERMEWQDEHKRYTDLINHALVSAMDIERNSSGR